jgi:hypothetical protein
MRHLICEFALVGLAACSTIARSGYEQQVAPPDAPRVLADLVDAAALRHDLDAVCAFRTRHTMSDPSEGSGGIGDARRWIARRFEEATRGAGREGGLACGVELESFRVEPDARRITRPVDVVNVVCTIPGARPEARSRHYYVVAHYDSRVSDVHDATAPAPGANDDGSGTVLLIELARVLARARLDATIVLLATAGEEQGLLGARLHAQQARESGIDIHAVLSCDIVGDPVPPLADDPDPADGASLVRVFSEGLPLSALAGAGTRGGALSMLRGLSAEGDSASRQLARYVGEIGRAYDLPVKAMLVFRPDRFMRGGDHTPFNELGIAAVRFTTVHENYDRQHQDVRVEDRDGEPVQLGDLPEFVDEVYLRGVAMLNLASIASLASAPPAPANARILTSDLSRSTTLRWDGVGDEDLAGYEVVWRDTTSPVWQHARFVGDATEATLPINKDNAFFGVRSVDDEGYRSLVSFPTASPR